MLEKAISKNALWQAVARIPDEPVEFLGYTIGRCYSPQTGQAYIGARPSRKAIRRLCRQISELTARRWTPIDADDRIAKLNRLLNGWSNYFRLRPVSKVYWSVDSHTRQRLRQWLCDKHDVQGRGTSRFPDEYLYGELGLVRLEVRTHSFPWANA